jgi:hypothetical protein
MANKQIHELGDTANPIDGTEYLPVDQSTLTGKSRISALRKYYQTPVKVVTDDPGSGGAVSIGAPNANTIQVIKMPGVYATLGITLPAADFDGQKMGFSFGNTVTTLSMSASGGQTLKGAPTTAGAATPFTFMYNLADTTWYRV